MSKWNYVWGRCQYTGRQILKHREVVQEYIGRKLESWEVVHHKDGNKKNNSLENLEIMSKRLHSKRHAINDDAGKRLVHGSGEKNNFWKHNHTDETKKRLSEQKKKCLDGDSIVKDYLSGMTKKELASKHSCSSFPINRILKEKGVSIRNNHRKDITSESILSMINELNISAYEVSKRLNVSRHQIYKKLRECVIY